MHIKSNIFFACFLCIHLLLSNSLFAQQYENQVIEKIEIEMLCSQEGKIADPKAIKSRIKTREGDVFSQIDFDNDLKALVKDYDHVEPEINYVDGRLFITLKIWPKPVIRSVNWEGNHGISLKDLQSELGICIGSVFDRQAFNSAFHKLKTYYVKQGFFEANLNYDIFLDPETNAVDINICIVEGRAGRIKKIAFINFSKCERDELLDMIVTKKYFPLWSWYTGEGTYNEDAVQQDRMVILNFLHNKGYSDATVDIDVCEDSQCNRIILNIIADRGEKYNFGTIEFEGNTLFCDEEIESRFLFDEGDPYSPDAIRDTIKRITDYYGRRGYIDTLVDYEAKLDCETRTYSVKFYIEEGAQYRVGMIRVIGNCTTKTNVILHETLLVPGEIFNIIKLQVTEERLKNIGFFKNVNVYAVKSEGPGGLGCSYRDVVIEVEENITGNFSAGGGLSTAESLFAEFKITERNFNHEGLLSFWRDGLGVLRGGGEYLSLSAMIGVKSYKYALSWAKPFFRDTPWLVGFEIENSSNRYISNDYDIHATGFTLHGAYQINQFLRFGVHYRLRNTYITLSKGKLEHQEEEAQEKKEEAIAEGNQHEAHKQSEYQRNLECKLKEEARNAGLISAIGVTLTYDSTNHPVFPTRGFRSRLEQELAGFWGDQTFMTMAYLNSYFYPSWFDSKGVFKFRGDMRFLVPLFDTKRTHIPIDERFFLGGDNTIRGYRVYRLGPQYNPGDPRGGLSLQLLSGEYTHVFNKRVSAFAFVDSGHLSMDVWNFGTMWTSVGFGVNLQLLESTPPIVLGIGFPLNPDHRSDVKRFFFNIGGRF